MSQRAAKDGVNVQVVVRCRPLNQKELARSVRNVVACTHSDVCVEDRGQSFKKYAFDRVFGPDSSQEMVFDEAIRPFVESVLEGFNCTVFAYGQTGTGKTYTMEGNSGVGTFSGELPSDAGIIPRTVKRIFQKLQGSDSTVTVNFLELYNEELTDLLDPWLDQVDKDGNRKKKVMRIMEEQFTEPGVKLRRGVLLTPYPEDCVVTSEAEILQILQRGSAQRQTAETLLNDKSSRSHSIFVISIHMKETKLTGEDVIKVGKLNLVDLAGSENISRAGSNRKEERQRETGSINQSLLTLGRVINALVDKSQHVPYRDSNLTRLLRDSLGGSTKTLMIATISSGESSQEETFKTLDYAKRAKSIKNKPEVNQRISKTDLVKDLHAEIKRLKEELVCQRRKEGVIVLPLEKHAQNETDRKNLLKQMDAAQDQVKELQKENEEVQHDLTLATSETAELRGKLLSVEDQLKEQSAKLEDQIYWSKTYQKNCEELTSQLKTQSSSLESTIVSLKAHKSALESLSQKLDENASISEELGDSMKQHVHDACRFLDRSLEECHNQMQKVLYTCNAKKAKREEVAEKLREKADAAIKLQIATRSGDGHLWSKTTNTVQQTLMLYHKEYQKLKRSTEDAVQSGFSQVQSMLSEQQQSWDQSLDGLRCQDRERMAFVREEQLRLLERKRKLDDLKKEAQAAEQLRIQKIQTATATILQETVAKCLKESMPKILRTTADALKPEKSTIAACASIMSELDAVISSLTQQPLLVEETSKMLVPECKRIHQETMEKMETLAEFGKNADVHSKEAAASVEETKNATEGSQEKLKESLLSLRQCLDKNLKEQRQESSLENEVTLATEATKTMAQGCSRRLVTIQKEFDAQTEGFDWTAPGLLVDESVSNEKIPEAVTVTDSSPENSHCTCPSGGKRVMKESQLQNAKGHPPRVFRRAKRGKQSEVLPVSKGSHNLNSDD